jgi:hypothetical protein
MYTLYDLNGTVIGEDFYTQEDASEYAQAELNLMPGEYIIRTEFSQLDDSHPGHPSHYGDR